jgi:hypothetical protein
LSHFHRQHFRLACLLLNWVHLSEAMQRENQACDGLQSQ